MGDAMTYYFWSAIVLAFVMLALAEPSKKQPLVWPVPATNLPVGEMIWDCDLQTLTQRGNVVADCIARPRRP